MDLALGARSGADFSLDANPIDEFINWSGGSGHEEIKRLSSSLVEPLHKSPTAPDHSHPADCLVGCFVHQQQNEESAQVPPEQLQAKSGSHARKPKGKQLAHSSASREKAREIVRESLSKNPLNPYPTKDEKRYIAQTTRLTEGQISTLFNNERQRHDSHASIKKRQQIGQNIQAYSGPKLSPPMERFLQTPLEQEPVSLSAIQGAMSIAIGSSIRQDTGSGLGTSPREAVNPSHSTTRTPPSCGTPTGSTSLLKAPREYSDISNAFEKSIVRDSSEINQSAFRDGIQCIPRSATDYEWMTNSHQKLLPVESKWDTPQYLPQNFTSTTWNSFLDYDQRYDLGHDDVSLSGCSSGNSSASSGGSDSSAGSEFSMFSNRRGKRSRRFKRSRSPSHPKGRLWCTYCWTSSRTSYDWKRHEESVHLPLKVWICDLEVHLRKFNADKFWRYCRLCGDINIGSPDLSGHFVAIHRVVECTQQPLQKRLFSRKDHLKQHLTRFHGMKDEFIEYSFEAHTAHTDSKGPFLCGFCLESLPTWEIRADHIANHFIVNKLKEVNWRISRTWTMSSQKHLKAHQEILEKTKSTLLGQPSSATKVTLDTICPEASTSIRELLDQVASANQEVESRWDATCQQPSPEDRALIDYGTLAQMGAFHAAIDAAKRLPLRDWQRFHSLMILQLHILLLEILPSKIEEHGAYPPDFFRSVSCSLVSTLPDLDQTGDEFIASTIVTCNSRATSLSGGELSSTSGMIHGSVPRNLCGCQSQEGRETLLQGVGNWHYYVESDLSASSFFSDCDKA